MYSNKENVNILTRGQADGQGKLTTENKVTYKGKFKQGIFKG